MAAARLLSAEPEQGENHVSEPPPSPTCPPSAAGTPRTREPPPDARWSWRPRGAVCGVDVRGGGPATRETDLLRPENMIEAVHAVVLAGGSAFGLAASAGVMDELAARGIGFPVEGARVPIVVGACLFDLLVGENAQPGRRHGRRGLRRGVRPHAPKSRWPRATWAPAAAPAVGKLLGGGRAMKAGLGICGLALGELAVVAVVAVNALGNVRDEDGAWIAGCRDDEGHVMDPLAAFGAMAAAAAAGDGTAPAAGGPCANTTIGVVLTNARLTKAQATKTASTVHDAYARAIEPVHTLNDGDTVFAFASGEVEALPDAVAVLACEAMQGAIVRAVCQAEGACGLPAARDLVAGRSGGGADEARQACEPHAVRPLGRGDRVGGRRVRVGAPVRHEPGHLVRLGQRRGGPLRHLLPLRRRLPRRRPRRRRPLRRAPRTPYPEDLDAVMAKVNAATDATTTTSWGSCP